MIKKMSTAFLRQQDNLGEGQFLNDTLHPQHYFIELDIKDPGGKLVCRVDMSYEQFVRLLLFQGNVPITLSEYRNDKGEMVKEKVEKPESVNDRMLKRIDESIGGVQNRITDLRKDLYELQNSGKSVGKKKIGELLHQMKIIEDHFRSNVPYVTKCAAEEVDIIQENAKSQLSIAINQITGGASKPEDFTKIIKGDSILALPDPNLQSIEDDYELKERVEKSIDEMTNIEVGGDAINIRLKLMERAEDKFMEANPIKDGHNRKQLYAASSSAGNKGKVGICYISYHGHRDIDLDFAKRYLKFLKGIKIYSEFKEHWNFEKDFEKDS